MCFKRESVSSLLNDKHPKLIDEFKYFGSNISSIESDVNLQLELKRLIVTGYQSYENLISLIE